MSITKGKTMRTRVKTKKSSNAVTRAVVVVDRGWIWAGDVEEKAGRIYLHRAVWVFRWSSIGFDGVIANPKDSNVTIKPMGARVVDIPADAEIFRISVDPNWGLP